MTYFLQEGLDKLILALTLPFALQDGLEVVDAEVLVWAEVTSYLTRQKLINFLLRPVASSEGLGGDLLLGGSLVAEILH